MLGGFGGVADVLNQYNHYLGDPGYLPKDLERYESATPAAVRQMAATLTRNARVVVYGIPGEKVIQDVPRRPEPKVAEKNLLGGPSGDEWRQNPPQPAKAGATTLPVPAQLKLANGLTVLLVEQHNLPVFTAALAVVSGSDANPIDKPGLASFTASMLTEGTQKRTSLQLADDIAQIGASFDSTSASDASLLSGGALTRNADKLFELLADVAMNPAFRDEEIERIRKQRLTTLLQQADDPDILATQYLLREVYGEKNPYGFLQTGTREATETTTRADMVNFYQNGYGPQNAALLVAGDITQDQLRGLVEKYFGTWTDQAKASMPPAGSPLPARRVVIVDKPASPQSVLRIGQVGLARNNPDYAPVTIMNSILGGLFSSRINLNLREAHGYTYGAFSVFVFRRGPGPFFVGTMVRTDATAPSVKEILGELDKMRRTLVKPEELAMAKETEVRGLTGTFETTTQTAGAMMGLFVYKLPLDYYSKLPQQFAAVDAADAQRVAQQYLTPEKMLVLAVGDRARIEPELKKLNVGPIKVLDAEGRPVLAKPAKARK